MISEVLLYLLMITCMLTQVSSKEVKWTVRDTSPKLGQDLTLFCKVVNCFANETKRWYGGSDKKPLMSNSGISTDKSKYNTAIENNGFILTILNLTVKDLNVSYTCSCGFDLYKGILYLEDVYKADNLNKSTNGTNYVGIKDAGVKFGYIAIPVILVILLIIVIVIKRHWLLRKLKEKIYGPRRRNSDNDNIQNVRYSSLPTVCRDNYNENQSSAATFSTDEDEDSKNEADSLLIHVESNQMKRLDEDEDSKNEADSLLIHVESNQRQSLDEDEDSKNEADSLLIHVESNQRQSLDEDEDSKNEADSLLIHVESNQRQRLDGDEDSKNEADSLLIHVESNQMQRLDEDEDSKNEADLLLIHVESNQMQRLDEDNVRDSLLPTVHTEDSNPNSGDTFYTDEDVTKSLLEGIDNCNSIPRSGTTVYSSIDTFDTGSSLPSVPVNLNQIQCTEEDYGQTTRVDSNARQSSAEDDIDYNPRLSSCTVDDNPRQSSDDKLHGNELLQQPQESINRVTESIEPSISREASSKIVEVKQIGVSTLPFQRTGFSITDTEKRESPETNSHLLPSKPDSSFSYSIRDDPASTCPEKRYKYADFKLRELRFQTWPLSNPTIVQLVDAGFFQSGDTNIAICFSCGNKIYCNEGQDPLHEAFHNNCEHLREITITSTQLKTACSPDQ